MTDKDRLLKALLDRKTSKIIHSILFNRCKNRETTKDLFQDVLEIVLNLPSDYTITTKELNWLSHTARNKSINWWRKNLRLEFMKDLPDLIAPPDPRIDPDFLSALSAIEELSPRKAEVFTLVKVYGYNQVELIALLNISDSTIDRAINQAGRQLKKRLEA